jgi:hypothetical protein
LTKSISEGASLTKSSWNWGSAEVAALRDLEGDAADRVAAAEDLVFAEEPAHPAPGQLQGCRPVSAQRHSDSAHRASFRVSTERISFS